MLGRTLGHYRILEQIGAGGMGVVYRARDERLERDVALKVLPHGALADEGARKRFRKEALALSRLNHPNIATVHDFDTDQDTDFLVMELIPGQTLAELIAAGSLAEKETLRLGSQMAEGLGAAHAEGVTHRDLKPGNLRITPDGRLKILDFGLATLVGPGGAGAVTASEAYSGAAGTLAYMSPEQLRGEEAGPRSDIYAAGAVLYEMAAGRRIFPENQGPRLIADILNKAPEPPPSSPSLRNIILKATDKDPARRYQSARELAVDLERAGDPSSAEQVIAARPRARRGAWAAAILVLLAASAAAFYYFRLHAPARIESLAVLPLENLSGDPAQEYFADGMTEALIGDLARIKALRVLPRTAVSMYRGAKKPPAQVAKELNVDAVLEGSVARSGDRVRVTANLIHPAANRVLWSERYEREMRDVLTLQGEVARAIAHEISAQLTPEEAARLNRARPVDPQAYEEFLRGQFHLGRQNSADNATAIEVLEHAVKLDPGFAPAFAGLAAAYGAKVFYFAPQDAASAEKAYVAAEKALALDPNLAEAHLTRGLLLWTPSNKFPHEKALEEFRRALQLNPTMDEAHHQHALVLLHIGLMDKALQEFEKTVALNPANTLARHRLGVTYLYEGKYQQALDLFFTTPKEFSPALWTHHVTWALFCLHRNPEASAKLDEQLKEDPQDRGGLLHATRALLMASASRPAEAEAAIQASLKQGQGFGHFHHSSYLIACAYAAMKRPEQALRYLESTADNGFPCYPLFANDPNLANLRSDPGYVAFMEKLRKLWEQWKATL